MRKLRRWAFNALTILSLLLCIATAAVWVRSYSHYFGIGSEAGEFPEDGRAIWEHTRLLATNRGTLLAQSEFREWPGDSFWSGPVPHNRPAAYFETNARSADWLEGLQYAYDSWSRAIHFGGFAVGIPRKSEVKKESSGSHGGMIRAYVLILPLWSLTLLFALLPSLSLLRLIRRRRIPPGHCRHCGYNLHANLSGTCPECGKPTATAKP